MIDRTAHEQRTAWYRQARFGMFIHWGLYAIPARGEWVRSTERMPEVDYLPYFSGVFRAGFQSPRLGGHGAQGRHEIRRPHRQAP